MKKTIKISKETIWRSVIESSRLEGIHIDIERLKGDKKLLERLQKLGVKITFP